MTQLLRQVSVATKFAAQFTGVLALTAVSAAGLALTGAVKLELAHPQIVAACVAATGLAAGAWTWLVGRSAARPMKEVLTLAQSMAEASGPVPFATDNGDEAARLLRQLSHVQERQQAFAKSYDALKLEQDDQQDEMAQWATDTLRLRAALDATQTDALITDEDGVILFVTKTLAKMLKEHQGKIKAVLPQVDLDRLVGQRLEAFSQAADGADLTILPTSDVETELRFAGLTFALRAQAIRDRKLEVAGHVVIWRDLTATLVTKSQHSALDTELAQLKQVLDLSVTPTHVVDLNGQICMANQALIQLAGEHAAAFKAANGSFQADAVLGRSAGMFYSDPFAAVAALKRLTARQTSRKVLGGRTYDVTDTPIRDADGQLVAVVCQWVDCTDAWLAERAFSALADRVSQGDYAKLASLDGIDGVYRQIGRQLNAVVQSMGETIAPVRAATEQLGNALAQVTQSTLSVQQTIQALARQPESERLPKPSAMLAEKAGALLAQMVPAINHTTELLQDPLNPHASEALASTAEQLQAQASLLQAMVASYRLAVGAGKKPQGERVTEAQRGTEQWVSA
ncbi:MAG: PAS domain-containing protein [Burkholderiales bacterium]|nr:PAS domain-containing protein [Burkholderiales bacterium]